MRDPGSELGSPFLLFLLFISFFFSFFLRFDPTTERGGRLRIGSSCARATPRKVCLRYRRLGRSGIRLQSGEKGSQTGRYGTVISQVCVKETDVCQKHVHSVSSACRSTLGIVKSIVVQKVRGIDTDLLKRLIYRININISIYIHICIKKWKNESKGILASAIGDRGGGEVERVQMPPTRVPPTNAECETRSNNSVLMKASRSNVFAWRLPNRNLFSE